MNNFEQPESAKTASRLEIVRTIIADSPAAVEAEFNRTENTWPECVGSRLFSIECNIDAKKFGSEVGLDRQQEYLHRLEELKERLSELKDQYPNKTQSFPDELKQELFDRLDHLLDYNL